VDDGDKEEMILCFDLLTGGVEGGNIQYASIASFLVSTKQICKCLNSLKKI